MAARLKSKYFLFYFLEFWNFVRIMRFLMDYAESCNLRSIMRNRNIAEYQKPWLVERYQHSSVTTGNQQQELTSNVYDVSLTPDCSSLP